MKRILDTDLKVDTLEEFINVLKCCNTKLIKYEDVFDQTRLLDYLLFLFSSDPVSQQLKDQELFVWPGVEQFYTELIAGLDPNLEFKANEVFKQGWIYISGFIGSHEAQHVVRRLLGSLGECFPRLQEAYEQEMERLVTEFFTPTVGEFLDAHTDSINQFSIGFPVVYELFIYPLITSSIYKNRKLFNFYCNPWIYCAIISYLAKHGSPHYILERHLEWLEERLKVIRSLGNDKSWEVLTNKSKELLDASDDLEAFANQCSGLLGEIKTAFYIAKNVCHSGDKLIFLEDDNSGRKKFKKKNCDLMVIRFSGHERIPVEVKTKSSRHGVDEANAGVWDNFFSNFSNSITSYLDYLNGRIARIFGLSLRQSLPLFYAHEGSGYGIALPLVYQTIVNSQTLSDSPANKWRSEKKIETLLRALFMKPLVLYPSCVPLASDEARLSERRQLIKNVIQKDWVRNTMQEAIEQLQVASDRQIQEGFQVSKLYLGLDLSLSYRLLQDPFSCNDADIKCLVAESLEEVFQPLRNELSMKGLDLELLLP